MKSGCGKSRYTCSTNINEEEIPNIFASYWNLGSHEKQCDFICQRVGEKPTKPGEDHETGLSQDVHIVHRWSKCEGLQEIIPRHTRNRKKDGGQRHEE